MIIYSKGIEINTLIDNLETDGEIQLSIDQFLNSLRCRVYSCRYTQSVSSSGFDAIVVGHPNNLFKSSPFQIVFATSTLKTKPKPKLIINDLEFPHDICLDQNGRFRFKKLISRKLSLLDDESDLSEDERPSRESSKQKAQPILLNVKPTEKLSDYTNEKATFWHFAWLFKKKQQQPSSPKTPQKEILLEANSLGKIKEEAYEGQETSREPLFHLSLCGNLLTNKNITKEQITNIFFKHRIDTKAFMKDPIECMNNPNLVVMIDKSIYTWQLGVAILTCLLAYGKSPSDELIDNIVKTKFTQSKWKTYFTGSGVTKLNIDHAKEDPEPRVATQPLVRRKSEQSRFVYSKVPSSDMINAMGLKKGQNKAKIILLNRNSQTVVEEVHFRIFLWDYNDKIVISDIDGTITKSDLLGQLLNNYVHDGVARLYSQLDKYNYKILYLTARAIGQYRKTLSFLENVIDDQTKLPAGPLLMNPDGYIKSLTREVYDKNPDTLKIRLLARINEIFPGSNRAFYCGFGNRDTDSLAYKRVNVPPQRIYQISESSNIRCEAIPGKVLTYPKMLEEIDQIFPVYIKDEKPERRRSKSEASEDKLTGDDSYSIIQRIHQLASEKEYSGKGSPSHGSSQGEEGNQDLVIQGFGNDPSDIGLDEEENSIISLTPPELTQSKNTDILSND